MDDSYSEICDKARIVHNKYVKGGRKPDDWEHLRNE